MCIAGGCLRNRGVRLRISVPGGARGGDKRSDDDSAGGRHLSPVDHQRTLAVTGPQVQDPGARQRSGQIPAASGAVGRPKAMGISASHPLCRHELGTVNEHSFPTRGGKTHVRDRLDRAKSAPASRDWGHDVMVVATGASRQLHVAAGSLRVVTTGSRVRMWL